MLNEKQTERMLGKLKRFENTIEPFIFTRVDTLDVGIFKTKERFHRIPESHLFIKAEAGEMWGGEENYCWFKGKYEVKQDLNNQTLFLKPHVGGHESLLWVNGSPFGTFTFTASPSHGNHYCDLLKSNVQSGEIIEIALESYAGHFSIASQPLAPTPHSDFMHRYESLDICVKNEKIADFYFDLKTFNQMASVLDKNSFVRANIIKTLTQIHEILYYSPDNIEKETFDEAVERASKVIKTLYEYKNTSLAPIAAVIGHSHMDTAWRWTIEETIKKCTRTFSNQLSLMQQYPEYKFVQSSAYHGKMIKDHYPDLFEKIKDAVKAGRYEPNGAVWIESDCNLVGGEMLLRQFLWGQRFTREHFGYTSNCFWLPDTFGYSPSIPQIMKGCGVDYFLTTKMAWNDTNKFPYDTFYWQGLDGTRVLTHLNKTHLWPDPETCIDSVMDGYRSKDTITDKSVSNMRLLAYGFGDGGGGPQFEMIEMARRSADLEGCPKVETMFVGDFMQRLEKTLTNPSVYAGELYLELHRGTLTNQHTIKRNNRLSEIRLHDLEYLTVRDAVSNDSICRDTHIKPLVETLLVNQFHDILPGTSIPAVHDRSIAETTHIIQRADELIRQAVPVSDAQNKISIINTLSFDRSDVIYLDYVEGYVVEGAYNQQLVTDISGHRMLAVSGVTVEALSSAVLERIEGYPGQGSCFTFDGKVLDTPFFKVVLDDRRYIKSFIDKSLNRELRGEGYALNTLLIAEDVPTAWDSWDIDADIELKFKNSAVLLASEIVSDGLVEFRIRNTYKLTEKSSLVQDLIFYSDSKLVKFETLMNWQDDHRLLKTVFDTNVFADFARQELQFGYIKRPTTRNTDMEKAKFEVCNHKYTDLSENKYGVSLLNDCKYGISVHHSQLALTLHKGGCRPDFRGDKGEHMCSYAFLPHHSGFDADSVIKPAYVFNYKPLIIPGECSFTKFISVSAPNIIVEAIKPCEDNEKAYVIRLYEAEGTYTNSTLVFDRNAKLVTVTNMLEEDIQKLECINNVELSFKPFEIKTIRISY
ncbi:glycosyl hydrolase-related protein [Paenibacillus sp. HWE-109]|uniref:alpha-mannosidase n=1 Tax=Paenibacillus sp. HWE-109 TaxID=1306526 RepID=UPI001EDE602E|nr:glycoside hydrolase family 38 C-terminal domain-containing protein [Paenibacillus sp. HWE-109]UKS29482.1 glycosyl hydrolase-related protein [Paenibacillus sp. HWE-109]